LQGAYIFGDFTGGTWKLENDGNNNWVREELLTFTPTSFAEDNEGELYLFHAKIENSIRKISPDTDPSEAPNTLAKHLSETGCVTPNNPTQPASGMLPYSINTPLWSDGAVKHRWLGLPEGEQISIDENGDFHFPTGTVLMKNFSFDGKPFETRLFMRHPNGEWAGYSYEWLEDLSDAILLPGGKSKILANGINWDYPSQTQCMECHTDVAGFTLGPEIAQINRQNHYPSTNRTSNQITTWNNIGLFQGGLDSLPMNLPALHGIGDTWVSKHLRARSYLHSNCSGCHRPDGPAQGIIDFRFNVPMEENICDVASSTNVGNKFIEPGDPAKSSISILMHTLGNDRMPPVGTAIVDTQATTLIDNWILDANICLPDSDTDNDGVVNHADNCQAVANADQQDIDKDGIGNLCDDFLNNDDKECSLDVDGNGNIDGLTDGLLFIRHIFGIRDESLIINAIADNCTNCKAPEIESIIENCAASGVLDIDGNGKIDALSDGLLTIRYLLDVRGAALTNGSVGDGCTRCTAIEIEDYLQNLIP
jgi:uncharacterized repeat protein (TIGR03806 family)